MFSYSRTGTSFAMHTHTYVKLLFFVYLLVLWNFTICFFSSPRRAHIDLFRHRKSKYTRTKSTWDKVNGQPYILNLSQLGGCCIYTYTIRTNYWTSNLSWLVSVSYLLRIVYCNGDGISVLVYRHKSTISTHDRFCGVGLMVYRYR